MKALYFDEHGELDVVKYGEVPTAEPRTGEVLVRVRACALNFLDIWVRRGWPGLKLEMPHWCGADVAGEIVELGDRVTGWQVGQRVVVDPGVNLLEDEYTRRGQDSVSPGYHVLGEHMRGGAAEYLAIPANNLAAMPAAIDFPDAAAPLLVSLTAWRMLIRQARLRVGESVLVVGAGGGVNSMAIQIAKLAGAVVYTVAGNPAKAGQADGATDVLLQVRGFKNEGRFEDISFELFKGEILGLSGLVGAGRSELAKAICGLYPKKAGEVIFKGSRLDVRSYEDAIRQGIVYLTEDRKTEGLFLEMPISNNIVAMDLDQVSSQG
jgi:NADPH:quinone reductase-like Zn-dependent oxidoreductase